MNGYETIDQIMQQLRYIFDGQTAKEVLEAYLASLTWMLSKTICINTQL